MKRASWFAVLLLVAAVPAFAASNSHSVSQQSQFHFPSAARKAAASSSLRNDAHHRFSAPENRQRGPLGAKGQPQNATHSKRSHAASANPPVGKLGFVSATQIPAGGGAGWPASNGDFNGDGKQDAVTIVGNYVSNAWAYSVSVVLSNGDGTFQAPVLTALPGNDNCAAFVVGDVNGDKKDDILIVHLAGKCSNSTSSFDVLIGNGDGTFTAGNNYPLSAVGLAGGGLQDVNGDTKLDVVVVDNANPSNVVTVLGNGDGTFSTTPTSIALSGQASSAVLADLNGDGILDVAATDYNTNQLTVYLATSASAYAAGVLENTADNFWDACSLAVGDLSGDGKPEIVTPNCGDDNITVYVNNGDGSFQTGVYYFAAANAAAPNLNVADVYPSSVTIADVNGDGKADIISSNSDNPHNTCCNDSSDVTVLLGNGDGTVNVPTVGYAVGGYPWSAAIVADFNGDGFPDILVTDQEYSLVYLKGYGDGTFRSALNYYSQIPDSSVAYGYTVATGDFNGDGIPDVVLGNCCDSTTGITVFLSRPDGSMQPGVNYSAGNLEHVVVADFNGDGKLDIAATDPNNGVVQIFTGNGDGTFTTGSTFPTDSSSNGSAGLVVGDFNKDGHPDLAVINSGDGNIGILLNDGNGNFPTVGGPYTLSASNSYEIATGDLNGDGKLDLAVPLASAGTVAILLGNGDGTFGPETDAVVGGSPYDVTIADLNGDGKPDLAASLMLLGQQGISVALGNGDGTFQTAVESLSSLQNTNWDNPYPGYVRAVDIDGDGKLDLVYTNSEYGTVGVLFGQGNGTFYDPVEFPSGGYAYGLAIADVNNDGSPDVVTAGDDFSGVTVLLNANGSATNANYTITAAPTTATVTAGQSATFTLTLTPSNHYNGTVTLSCGTLPSLATCTFNPPSVTLDGSTPATVQLTIATAAVSASLQAPHRTSSILLASLSGVGLFGMMLGGSLKKRNRWTAIALGMLILAVMFSVACGGGSKTTPGGNNQNPAKTATTTTVSSSQPTVMVGQTVIFTGTVAASSGSPTGTVAFLDGTTKLGTGTISGTTATLQTSSLAAGIHNITASYGGDTNFNASTSSALNQTVDKPGTPTGSYTVTVSGTGTAGTNNGNTTSHPFNLTLTVQ